MVVSAFEIMKLESILYKLDSFRMIAVFNDSHNNIYSWNAVCDPIEPGCSGVTTSNKPKYIFKTPFVTQMSDPDSV